MWAQQKKQKKKTICGSDNKMKTKKAGKNWRDLNEWKSNIIDKTEKEIM
jgi:hypothetical protein